MRLGELLDMSVLQTLTEANYKASGMPIGIIDALDGSILVGHGWQDICMMFHRTHPVTLARCRESDDFIKAHLSESAPCEYRCRNGLRDIGVPIMVSGEHLATLFLGQFFYDGEVPDRAFFVEQAREVGFDDANYLAALDRVPVLRRRVVENILDYNRALARFIGDLAEGALRRRQAEAEAQSLARFPREIPDPVLRLAPDLAVVFANEPAQSKLSSLDIVIGGPAPEQLAVPARRAARERQRVEAEVPSGGRVYSMTFAPAPDGVNVYAHDITDRRRMEDELRLADRRKDEFLSMLSHELRNPLAPIRSSVYVLRRANPGGEQVDRAYTVIERQTEHLTRLVDDLLDVTRIVRGKVELHRTELDLGDLARKVGEDYRGVMHDRGLTFEVEVPPQPVVVDGDATRLAQVIGNLFQNVVKFTPAGGRVVLSVLPHRDGVEVRVRDTGSGIEPALLEDIFEPFVQAKQPLARSRGGVGLGLALVKGLIELHGGTVEAESDGLGQGATFTFRLPLVPSDRAVHDERRDSAPAALVKRRRVLVVDDNRDAADSLAELVRILGHEAEVGYDGRTAIEKVKANPPDVVLCDLGLPDVSGYEVARALRSDRGLSRVQLVAVSGYAQPEDRQRALDAGFDEHLPKPPDPEKLGPLLASNGAMA